MLREVEVGARVDTLHLLEAKRHVEFDVGGGVGVVGELLVVVVAVVFVAHAERLVPGQTMLLPVVEPLHLRAGLAEELHLHLLKLAHAEDELSGHDLVAEGLADLGNAEGQLHASRLLYVEVVDEDALCGLRTQIDRIVGVGSGTKLSGEHEVELAYVGPVLRSADRADDALVEDDLLQFLQVGALHGLRVALVEVVALLLVVEDAGIGGTEFLLVEALAKSLGSLLYLLVNLLLILADLVLDEVVGTVALLRVAVVDQGVVECVDMAAGLPHRGVHEDGGVDTDDVGMEEHHGLPPVLLDIIFQLHAVLTVVVNGGETIIDFRTRKDKAILFAMAYYLLEYIFLCHNAF